jgi:NAD(P)-dependent dehydrogenase (short-subunit alcohol dehydrogenase family)
MKHILILGASRGLGHAFNLGLPERGDTAWLVSRTPPTLEREDDVARHWIQADLAQSGAAAQIAAALGGVRLDALLYNAGIWEAAAFGPGYDFACVPPDETERILAINLTSAIHCVQALLPNLRQSDNPKVILIGSVSGLENTRTPEVAYAASKFGLRGAAHALRESLRPLGIGVTLLNPGTIATQEPYATDAEVVAAKYAGREIPVHDLVRLVKCVVSLSRATVVKEADVPALNDPWA